MESGKGKCGEAPVRSLAASWEQLSGRGGRDLLHEISARGSPAL